jgi:hypothetical protein
MTELTLKRGHEMIVCFTIQKMALLSRIQKLYFIVQTSLVGNGRFPRDL